MDQLRKIFPSLCEDDIRAAIASTLPSPLRQFIHDQASLLAAFAFAGVGLAAAGLGGFGFSLALGDAGWPVILSLLPIFVPAAAAAIAVFLLVKRI